MTAALGAAVACAACADVDRRTLRLERVAPAEAGACGSASDGRAVLVSALGDFPVSETTARFVPADGPDVAIDQFPAGTRVLEVSVLGPGAAVSTAGRTASLRFEEIPDGAAVPILMAPPRGVCPTGSMMAARRDPLLARAGSGVLVAGGVDGAGVPVPSVELYDPGLGQFSVVAPTTYASGPLKLVGASLTELVDGRVVLAGGADQGFATFEPDLGSFSSALLLPTRRAHHAAVALNDGRVLLAGGCGDLDGAGACEPGTALADTVVVDVDSGEQSAGPPLAGARIGGRALVEDDGRVLIVGGVDESGAPVARAERIDPLGGGASEGLAEVAGIPVRLASGATLVAFGSSPAASSSAVSVVAPGAAAATRLEAALTARGGAPAVGLDDGSVLVIGGAPGGSALTLFEPVSGAFAPLDLASPALPRVGLRAIRLDDGAALIVGGDDGGGGASDRAFVYRHDLTHEFSSRLQAVVADPVLSFSLSPSDPGLVRRVGASAEVATHVRIEGADGPLSGVDGYVVGGGPGFVDVSIEVRAAVDAGGIAVLFGFRGAADYLVVVLSPGDPPSVRQVAAGLEEVICRGGEVVGAEQIAEVAARLDVRGSSARLTLGGTELIDCDLGEPSPRGLVGVGAVGSAGAVVRLERLSAER